MRIRLPVHPGLKFAIDLLARKITTQLTTQVGGQGSVITAPAASDCAAGGNGAPRGTRTHDPLIKKSLNAKSVSASESDNFPGLKELSEFWPL